jgi:Asp-tRNA(Asn)/Glu-tRNA(Gln) amidotransferase A subunit family amidase
MERVRTRVKASDNATDNVSNDVNEALDYAARIAELEEEMIQIAEEKGLDITALQERLAHSTTNRLEVLSSVYENAPEAAHQGIENAIENSVHKYERAVEKLREANALDETSANTTALQKIPVKIKEKLHIQLYTDTQAGDKLSTNVTIQKNTGG